MTKNLSYKDGNSRCPRREGKRPVELRHEIMICSCHKETHVVHDRKGPHLWHEIMICSCYNETHVLLDGEGSHL